MAFIYNALDEGWQVIKKTDRYIFTKKHEGRKEVLSDDYLKKFIVKNFSLDKLINWFSVDFWEIFFFSNNIIPWEVD